MIYNIDIDCHIGDWGCSQSYIRRELSAYKSKPVAVRVNSLGGSVSHALDIRQQFIDHGQVTCYLFGFVASAATILATGANKVVISRYAFYKVHKVSNWIDAWGQYNADQLQQLIEELKANKTENDKIDAVIATLYSQKTGKTVTEILDILKADRWLTAQEAFDLGFVDEIIEEGEKLNIDDAARRRFERYNISSVPSYSASSADPQVDEATAQATLQLLPVEKRNWFAQVVDTLFHASKKSDESTSHTTEMNKNFVKLNTLLAVEGFEVGKDNQVVLTVEQLEKLNSKIEELENSVSKHSERENQLQQQVDAFNKADGDETHKDHSEGKEKMSAEDMFNEVKDFI